MRVVQVRERIDGLLSLGIRELAMTLGVLAHIGDQTYELVCVKSNSGAFVPGEKYALGETYCRDVHEEQKIIARTSIDNSTALLRHPLYRSLPLECYIGAPVTLSGVPWGCLNFSSMAQRDNPFSSAEIELVESLAREVSQLIESELA